MKKADFLKTIIPKINSLANSIVDISLIKDKSWFLVNEYKAGEKLIYLFKSNFDLLIVKNGHISKGKWESVVHSTNSLIIEHESSALFYNILFISIEYLILQQDGTNEYLFFVKQDKYDFSQDHKLLEDFLDNYIQHLKYQINIDNKSSDNLAVSSSISPFKKEIESDLKSNIESNPKVNKSARKILPDKLEKNMSVLISEDFVVSDRLFHPKKINGYWGYVDDNEKHVIDNIFDDAFPYFESMAAIVFNGKKGYIDNYGKVIIPPIYENGGYFKNGKTKVELNSRVFFIDKSGRECNE